MKVNFYAGPLVGKIFRKIAPKIGAKVIMEASWNIAGQIVYKSGKKRYFRYSSLDLNTLGASEISKDKDYANLSSGGDAIDVTSTMHKDFCMFAVKLTRDMGLRLCGVDIMVDGDITLAHQKFWVLEINSAPGLDHYVKTGKAQQKILEDMYLEVLKHWRNNYS